MKVMCIDADFTQQRERIAWRFINELPKEGEVYEVAEVVEYTPTHCGYILVGVDAGINPLNGKKMTFNERRFLLLQDDREVEVAVEEEELCSMR